MEALHNYLFPETANAIQASRASGELGIVLRRSSDIQGMHSVSSCKQSWGLGDSVLTNQGYISDIDVRPEAIHVL